MGRRRRASGYVAHSGAISSGANFVQLARAVKTPRAGGEVTSQNPKINITGWIASFVFELDTYWVNGYAAQAKASVAASRHPPKRLPTSASPTIARTSNRIDVNRAASRSSPLPFQPIAAYPGR